jgi:hypothetical protein
MKFVLLGLGALVGGGAIAAAEQTHATPVAK